MQAINGSWTLTQRQIEAIICASFLEVFDEVCAPHRDVEFGKKFVKDSQQELRDNVIIPLAEAHHLLNNNGALNWPENVNIKIRDYPTEREDVGFLFGPDELILSWSDADRHQPEECAKAAAALAEAESVETIINSPRFPDYFTGQSIAQILRRYRDALCDVELSDTVSAYFLNTPGAARALLNYALGVEKQDPIPENVDVVLFEDPNDLLYKIHYDPTPANGARVWTLFLPFSSCPEHRVFDDGTTPGCKHPCDK